MPLALPHRLSELLHSSPRRGAVLASIDLFEPWLARSGVPFFRDYTDHGPRHIEEVLETMELLIAPEAWNALTPNDAAFIVESCLIHDAALHLQEDGFVDLLAKPRLKQAYWPTDTQTWAELWNTFSGQSRRLGQRELQRLFGTTSPIPIPDPTTPESWTRLQYDLIGEFLRRYHPRLAMEIAIDGVPTLSTSPLRLAEQDPRLRLLAGLIARSHGETLRESVDITSRHFDARDYNGVHCTYLAALLRIADYVQIQPSRATRQLLQVKRIKSPLSRREWNVHHAIDNITYNDPDPEAIRISARPDRLSAETLWRLQEWLTGIQQELDATWAVLGEVYGRFGQLRSLGINLRRVRSNVTSNTLPEMLTFHPIRAAFRTADADLLKLLIRPLYGDIPGIGVRELIQNAVDAVNELHAHLDRRGDGRIDRVELPDCDVLVYVDKLSDGTWRTSVLDRGIGMTAETVANYFLRAGASFRQSDAWQQAFVDSNGQSRVVRAGRFGVGALAAFLLGEVIRVTTRHIDAAPEAGVQFQAALQDENIELHRVSVPVGTTVEVFSRTPPAFLEADASKRDFERSTWDWFCLTSPRVSRVVAGHKALAQASTVPSFNEATPPGWNRIYPDGFKCVDWTYFTAPRLICNGIFINDLHAFGARELDLWASGESRSSLELPKLSVFDPDGRLPLSLDRQRLTTHDLDFLALLRKSIEFDLLAYLLVCAPTAPLWDSPKWYMGGDYPGTNGLWRLSSYYAWFSTIHGTSFLSRWHLSQLGPQSVLVLSGPNQRKTPPFEAKFCQCAALHSYYFRDSIDLVRYGVGPIVGAVRKLGQGIATPGAWALVPQEAVSEIEVPKNVHRNIRTGLKSVASYGEWRLLRAGTPQDSKLQWSEIAASLGKPRRGVRGICEVTFAAGRNPVRNSVFERLWAQYIGAPIIPYDPTARRSLLRHAFEHPDLAPRIAAWETLAEAKGRDLLVRDHPYVLMEDDEETE